MKNFTARAPGGESLSNSIEMALAREDSQEDGKQENLPKAMKVFGKNKQSLAVEKVSSPHRQNNILGPQSIDGSQQAVVRIDVVNPKTRQPSR
jgi:hypothetical protein